MSRVVLHVVLDLATVQRIKKALWFASGTIPTTKHQDALREASALFGLCKPVGYDEEEEVMGPCLF